eukprot:CAMPEP_0205935140 /NCGR_PEP_ID=MMETSP1325-20131115/38290_1 /ASSEMBLY_ACC=CAM_ASM_000708 /TAXON_ID=236786 /ORGANISM="Florenciella sp., Strain RCC1007" /LENGTH=51 /DNA_ID=CAMNT_0053305209 /DNA_START=34 /DNA_END=185 /DNA_ORIENTATION=-
MSLDLRMGLHFSEERLQMDAPPVSRARLREVPLKLRDLFRRSLTPPAIGQR